MNSLICLAPGQFEYHLADKPELSKGRAIIKIRRVGVCGTDLHAYGGNQPFFTYPRILGHELAGELEDADDAAGFSMGDAVTFIPYFPCGSCVACRAGKTNCCVNIQVCGVHVDGGMVEYLSVPSSNLLHGMGLSFDELALVEPLAIGAHAVKRAAIGRGEFVLIIGAGPIGLGAMEFARRAGATVIVLDINDNRLNFCRNHLNVQHLVNGLSGDVGNQLREITYGDMPAVVMDATGNRTAINNAFQYMAHGGRYILIGLQRGDIAFSHPEFHKREGTLMSSRNATREDFLGVIDALTSCEVDARKFISHRVKFDQVKDEFENWLRPEAGVIKAMIEL